MATALDRFAEAAEAYCAWCQAEPGSELEEARTALRHLLKLYSLALELKLPDLEEDIEAKETGPGWKAIFKRFSALPVNYYSVVFNPLEVPSEEPVAGDLADDLADTYRDLSTGLALFREGHRGNAEWEWRFSFQSHWGRHASSAIGALHCWFADNGKW